MRQVRVHGQLDLDLSRSCLGAVPAEVGNRLAHQTDVEVEADAGDMAGLFATEHVAGTTNLEVLHRHLHSGAEVGMAGDSGQPVVRGLGERLLRGIQEVGVGAFTTSTHPTAELVELAQAEYVGPLHDEGVGVGDVQTGLDDRGADQDIEALLPEVDNDLLQLVLGHLPVGGGDPRLGHELTDPGGRLLDGGHLVVDQEHLALTEKLAPDGGGDLLFVIGPDEGQDRVTLLGRRGQGGHLADTGDSHLQGSRDGRRRQSKNINCRSKPFELFLVLDPETLLLIDHHQPEVLETNLV